MIRVVHVVTHYSSVVTILRTKLAALASYEDLDVTVISGPPPAGEQAAPPPVPHIPVRMARSIRPPADLQSVLTLAGILRRGRFDIVHTHTAKAGVIGALAGRMARIPLVVHTYHGLPFYDGQNRLARSVYRVLEWSACRLRDHVFSQNRRDLAECARLMRSAQRVGYEGNGVDVDQVQAASRRGLDRAERDYPPGRLRLAMLSRLEPVKRVDDFIDACILLMRQGLDFSAVVAGEGPLRDRLQKRLDEAGLASRVRLVGWATHAPSLLALSDIVVLTSEKEGLPRALMEAMALGRPVVATDVPGTQEVVVDGQTGFLVPPGSAAALAGKIMLLAGDADLRARLGLAGRARVEASFNDVRIAECLHRFYVQRMRSR